MHIRLLAPLVGSHFHPPAKTLLALLPSSTPLSLQPEPDNPYDSNAIQVLLAASAIPERLWPQLDESLPAQGCTLEQMLSTAPVVLGHIAASGGKPLSKLQQEPAMPPLSGTLEWKDAVEAQALLGFRCQLAFAPSGTALVEASWEESI